MFRSTGLPRPTGPLYSGYFADPFVLRHAGRYYAYGTGRIVNGLVFEVLTSDDLIHWTSHGGALEPLGSDALSAARLNAAPQDYWAPEVAEQDGTFYLYYSVGNGDKGHHLRVASAAQPQGPFHDLGVNLTPAEPFAIDPHPFRASDGQWYLYFARDDLTGERPGTVLAAAALHDMTRLAGARTILRASADWQRYQAGRDMYGARYDWHTLEGAFVVQRHEQFHLLYSGGAWTGETYGVGYAVAAHPLGPFYEPRPGPSVLQSSSDLIGPGHASVTGDVQGDLLAFHAWNASHTLRQLHIARLRWENEFPVADFS